MNISSPLPPHDPTLEPNSRSTTNGTTSHPSSSSGPSPAPSLYASPLMGDPAFKPKGDIPNTPLVASLISSALGALVGASLLASFIPLLNLVGLGNVNSMGWAWAKPQLGIYLVSLGLFHLSEFWVTAGWNPKKLSVDAFLLNNTPQYHIAHAVGLSEYLISSYFWPSKFQSVWCQPSVFLTVVVFMFAAQSFRIIAMIQASASFSHLVKAVKLDDHVLVTHGVYAYCRHPSYVGFFYWAIATQLLLGNVVSSLGFVIVLGRFFSKRIISEERFLVKFFGDEYIQYRRRVGTGLPFFISQS